MNINKAIILKISLALFLVFDLGYSFYQHYHMPLSGDMADVVMPSAAKGYYEVLHDPFGFRVLLHDEIYPNPNRFFAHWTTSVYFLQVPLILQNFTDPMTSVYLSIAIAKILIQILIICLLVFYITNRRSPFHLDFLITAALLIPLFQTSGFNRTMGIIDQSVIYSFFYAFPIGLLFLFFIPFYKAIYNGYALRFSWFKRILLILFMLYLGLNGPLVPGVVLIICPLILARLWHKAFRETEGTGHILNRGLTAVSKIPREISGLLIVFCVICLYSLYIGRNNELNHVLHIPMIERYSSIPAGLNNLITKKIAWPLLLGMLAINVLLIRNYYHSSEARKVLSFILFIGIFSIIYLLLLPLGGFRDYRPNILRYDTILPVTIGIFLTYGMSSFYLIRHIKGRYKNLYIIYLAVFLAIFYNADRIQTQAYDCERDALEKISGSTGEIVRLENDCPVMGWYKVTDYHSSDRNAELLKYWNITAEKKLFYHTDE